MHIEMLPKIHLGGKSVDCTEEIEQQMNMMINPSGRDRRPVRTLIKSNRHSLSNANEGLII